MSRNRLAQEVIDAMKQRGGCAYIQELAEALKEDEFEVFKVLVSLEAEGAVLRDSSSPIDYTKPITTTKWCLKKEVTELLSTSASYELSFGSVVGVVANPPLLKDAPNALKNAPVVGLLDCIRQVLCSAHHQIDIMVPYIGDMLNVLCAECFSNLSRLRGIRIITERTNENVRLLESLKKFLPSLKVAYATQFSENVKISGVHTKVIIVDEETAIVGTFNLTNAHLFVNYDIGLVVKGPIVGCLVSMFNEVWDKLGEHNDRAEKTD
ncbi:MAG: phospholipase D family protein [Thermoproteota archaeon]